MARRLVDILLSLTALLLLSPLLALIALLVKLGGGPVFFGQPRVGVQGRLFRLYKFRTMVVGAQRLGTRVTAGGDARITGLGRLLRRGKLDELPQLYNILKGEMSFVGPRPELPAFVALWPPDQRRMVLSVRPGLTDYATLVYHHEEALLAGRDDPEEFYRQELMPRKLALSYRYVLERGWFLDARLLLATLWRLVGGRALFLVPELAAELSCGRC